MKKLTILGITVSAIMLTACKTDISTEIPFSGMLSDGIKETTAELKVEVAACEDFEDSRKESDTLVKARDAILKMVPTASFVDCHKEKFDSYATFNLRVNYGQGDFSKTENISILTAQDQPGIYSTALLIPPSIKKAINDNQRDKFSMERIDLEKLKIRVNLKNDLDKSVVSGVMSAFFNGTPVQYTEITFPASSSTEILLSNVSTMMAFNEEAKQLPLILSNTRTE